MQTLKKQQGGFIKKLFKRIQDYNATRKLPKNLNLSGKKSAQVANT